MSEEKPPPFKCSFMDMDAGGIPCSTPAKWACRVEAGPWMLGWWGCDEHKPYLEGLLPVIDTPKGHKAIPVMTMLTRSPLILSMDYLATGQMGQPMIMTKLTCDKCGKPIFRANDQWLHLTETGDSVDHKALPG